MDNTSSRLTQRFTELGWQGRVVKAERLAELERELATRCAEGRVDSELLMRFDFAARSNLPHVASLVVVAVPQPAYFVSFIWNGERKRFLVPPTYLRGSQVIEEVQRTVEEVLRPSGYGIAHARLPEKLLAARSGLSTYGRNNLAYAPGMGSFLRIVALLSDLPCNCDSWQDPALLPFCEGCDACIRCCPGGALASLPSGFLAVTAERCITYWDGKPRAVPWPAWMTSMQRGTLLGCIRCQQVCPANRPSLEHIEIGPEFSEEETALILSRPKAEQLPADTRDKLEAFDMLDFLDVHLPRNLAPLLGRGCVGAPCEEACRQDRQ
jgi:epoxyqueuosine reductase